jgi:hypothetical protein
MSRAFLDRNSQNDSNSSNKNTSQQKVTYEAQMKRLDDMINNPRGKTFYSPAQMFAEEEEEEKQARARDEEELQMKPEFDKEPKIDEFDFYGNQKEKNNNKYQEDNISFSYPKMDKEVLANINSQNEIIFAEKKKIYGFIIDDIVNLINNDDYAVIEVGYIEPSSEEYNIIWEEIYRNVKINISLMPVKTALLENIDNNFKISNIDILYKNASLNEYKKNKIKEKSKEYGKKIFKWGKILYKIIKGQGPKIIGKTNLLLGFFFKSKEAGKGSSVSERRQERLNELRKRTNLILDEYMLKLFETLSK